MREVQKAKFACPECGSSEVRWRVSMNTYICKRCGNVFGSYKDKSKSGSKSKPKKRKKEV